MNIFEKALELEKQNKPFVLATIVKVEGSTPGKIGFKIIIEDKDKTFGTVGGGEIEQEVISESIRRMKTKENGIVEYLLSGDAPIKDEAKVLNMSCSGRCWVFYEVFGNKPVVYIFGGGHVGHALLKQLSLLNFHKILIDNRPEFANKEANPYADEIILSDYSEYAYSFNPPEDAFIVVMTHGHGFDFDVIEQIYARNLKVRYIGVIASKTKAQKLKNQIKEIFGDMDLSNFHSPIGLDIGGETPQEIALSIAAELQAELYKKVLRQ